MPETAERKLPQGTQYDWEEVVKLEPKGYAEFRFVDAREVLHGVVDSITIDERDLVTIRLKWVGALPLNEGGIPMGSEWEVAENNPIVFPNLIVPFTLQETPEKGPRLMFGFNLIYLDEGTAGFDPTKVKGLVLDADGRQVAT